MLALLAHSFYALVSMAVPILIALLQAWFRYHTLSRAALFIGYARLNYNNILIIIL